MSISIGDLIKVPVTTMTKQQVMDKWQVSAYFIDSHKAAMGGRGKPVLFDALIVEEFFRDYFRKSMITDAEKKAQAEAIKAEIDAVIGSAVIKAKSKVRMIRINRVEAA